MAEIQWEKDSALPLERQQGVKRSGRWKFLVIGVVILGAIGYLLYTSSLIGARYYVTVNDLVQNPKMLGKTARVSGAVVGDPVYDPQTHDLTFVIANIPNTNDAIRKGGGLALVLHKAVQDPTVTRLKIVVHNKEIPDMLKNEAQAILSGKLQKVNGEFIFYADDITLKCPTRYQEDVPNQVSQ